MKKTQADWNLSYAKTLPETQTETCQKTPATQHPSPKKAIWLSHSRVLLSSQMNQDSPSSARHIGQLQAPRTSVTTDWLHSRAGAGMALACLEGRL